MSLADLTRAANEAAGSFETLTVAAESARKTMRETIREMQANRISDTLNDLQSGPAGAMFDAWWQIAIVDANSPALDQLLVQIRRLFKGDLSFLLGMKRELVRIQQKNRSTRGGRKGGTFAGALDEQQAQDILAEYGGAY